MIELAIGAGYRNYEWLKHQSNGIGAANKTEQMNEGTNYCICVSEPETNSLQDYCSKLVV